MKSAVARSAFATVVRAFADDPRVEAPTEGRGRFGSTALKVNGHIFAMSVAGALVLKLSRERVAELIAVGAGEPFVVRGRTMREWVRVKASEPEWANLAREALRFSLRDAGGAGRSDATR